MSTTAWNERFLERDIQATKPGGQDNFLVDLFDDAQIDILSANQSSWIRHLVEHGHLQPYSREGSQFAGAAVELSSFRPPLLKRVHFANMFLWGPEFFASSAFMMATIVSRIVAHLFPSKSEHY